MLYGKMMPLIVAASCCLGFADNVLPKYQCDPNEPSVPLSQKFGVGTNLGGWLVLEPWITPSLFYQFLGATKRNGVEGAKSHTGMDSYTFCTALGAKEGNRQLRQHWKTWLTEAHIKRLHEVGVRHVRIPVADWMFKPYGPYEGCFDGATEELDRALSYLTKYNMTSLLDIHCVKDSANGLDNGGHSMHVQWSTEPDSNGVATWDHYNFKAAHWIGQYNISTQTYGPVNYANLNHTLQAYEVMIDMYHKHPAVFGMEPVNEPWVHTPPAALKDFYWRAYQLVHARAPHWLFIIHDSFNATMAFWGGFLEGCPNWGIDSHLYQAWNAPAPIDDFVQSTCTESARLKGLKDDGFRLIVGEWSLATDNCAMWLNGFNDNLPGYPLVECERVPCAAPYMGSDQPGAPPPLNGGVMSDPHGVGGPSFVINGTCPIDLPFPDEDVAMKRLIKAKLFAYHNTHGHFYWNFRTEIAYRCSFEEVINRGWLDIKQIQDYNSWVDDGQLFEEVCTEYLPPIVPPLPPPPPPSATAGTVNPTPDSPLVEGEGNVERLRGKAPRLPRSWAETLTVWLLLCAAAYMLITVVRRVCRSYTSQPYTIIEDVNEEGGEQEMTSVAY